MIKAYTISLIQQYGAFGALIGLALEFLGLPVPGETLMSFLGFASWKHGGNAIYINLVFSTAGTFSGSMLAWLIGRRYGETVLLKFGKYIHITGEKLDSVKRRFEKRKAPFILFSRYIPGVRHIVPYLSGISGVRFGTFLTYNLIGSVIWCGSFIGLGFILGERWTTVERLIKTYSIILVLLAVFVFVVVKYFSRHKKTIFAITFPVLLFIKLGEDMIQNELSVFDNTLYKYVSRLISEDMTDFMKFISFLGSGSALIFIVLASMLLFRKNRKYFFYSKAIAVNLAAVSLLNEVFKVIFHRERPDILRLVEAGGFSFPSGHSMISLSFYGLIAYLFCSNMKSRWRYLIAALLSVLILSIGISRVYLGVHYASDVLAGYSAGLVWLAIFITLANRLIFK